MDSAKKLAFTLGILVMTSTSLAVATTWQLDGKFSNLDLGGPAIVVEIAGPDPDASLGRILGSNIDLDRTVEPEALPYLGLFYLRIDHGVQNDTDRLTALADQLVDDADITFVGMPYHDTGRGRPDGFVIPLPHLIVQGSGNATAAISAMDPALTPALVTSPAWDEDTELIRIRCATGVKVASTANQLRSQPTIAFVEPNFLRILKPAFVPDDSEFDNQWALQNTGQNGGLPGKDIGAVGAWDLSLGHVTSIVAVVDEGVDLLHEDLAPNLLTGYDAVDGDDDPTPNPWDAHGTCVAGIVAARIDNSTGIAGVAGQTKILPIRVAYTASPEDPMWITTNYWLADGIATAALMGADVINNSWGGGPRSEVIDFAVGFAKHHGREGLGCVIVCAAGNEEGPVSYPAISDSVIAVSATNEWDEFKTTTSSDGETWWGSNFGPEIDVAAPGVHIWTTDIMGTDGYNDGTSGDAAGNYYSHFNGTSSAAPFVSGLAALITARNSSLTSAEVQTTIEDTAEDLSPAGADDYTGHGRINAEAAVQAAAEYRPVMSVNGTIDEETFWSADTVYVVQGHLSVAADATLHIPAGTVVKFDINNYMHIYGTLDLQGTDTDPVYFTSIRDDSIGGDIIEEDEDAAAGNWALIQYNNTENTVHHAVFRYAGYGSNIALWLNNCAIDVTACSFENIQTVHASYAAPSRSPKTSPGTTSPGAIGESGSTETMISHLTSTTTASQCPNRGTLTGRRPSTALDPLTPSQLTATTLPISPMHSHSQAAIPT